MNKLFIFIPSEGKQYFNYYYKQIFDFFKQKGLKNVNQNLYEPGKKDAKKDPRIKKDYKQYLNDFDGKGTEIDSFMQKLLIYGLVYGDKLGEFLLKKLVLGLEFIDLTKSFVK